MKKILRYYLPFIKLGMAIVACKQGIARQEATGKSKLPFLPMPTLF
jgi:hypothetical protein